MWVLIHTKIMPIYLLKWDFKTYLLSEKAYWLALVACCGVVTTYDIGCVSYVRLWKKVRNFDQGWMSWLRISEAKSCAILIKYFFRENLDVRRDKIKVL